MDIRRVLTLAVAVATLAGAPTVVAQQNKQPDRREQERRSQQEQRDIQALVQMVDAVSAGKQPAPSDIGLQWTSNHFVRAGDGATLIPFTFVVEAGKLAAPGAALYVRAVSKNAAPAPAPAAEQSNRGRNQPAQPPAVVYPWDDFQFLDVGADSKVTRAMAVKPGEYEIFIAIKEKGPLEVPRNAPPARIGLLRRDITVPDYNGPELTTSTPIIATSVAPLPAPLTPEEQRVNPYTFGGMLRVEPSPDAKLKSSGELQMLFWIYGAQNAQGKPDVLIEYAFHQKTADGEKPFVKAQPQSINPSTLPPTFDVNAGHQVLGFLGVPLKTFAAGDYRVEVKITDKLSGKTLTQNATFTVEA